MCTCIHVYVRPPEVRAAAAGAADEEPVCKTNV